MKATLLFKDHIPQPPHGFVELVLWLLPKPIAGSHHLYKYRLALVMNGICVLRYDNEAGKGDHKHYGLVETQYKFESPEQLLADFWLDVAQWRDENE